MRGAERPGKGGRGTGGDRFLTKGLSGTSPMSPMFAKFIAQIRVCVCVCVCVCVYVCVCACVYRLYVHTIFCVSHVEARSSRLRC